jgi:hypothetical protein
MTARTRTTTVTSQNNEKQLRMAKANLRMLARALNDAQQHQPARQRTLQHLEQLVSGPVLVKMSVAQAKTLAELLRDIAAGKPLNESLGVTEKRRGRPSDDGRILKLFVDWLRLRRGSNKSTAYAKLTKLHPTAPSIARLDRWWNAQSAATRDSIFDIAEDRTYQRSGDRMTVTRKGPDLSKVIARMKRGEKRGRL